MDNKKTVFLTGATGLVGSYLLKILLQDGHKVYVLARGKDDKSARDRVIGILKFWDKNVLSRKSHNLAVLEGDITEKDLGLNKQSIDLLKNEIEEIFHCAAVTKFNSPLGYARKVNVEGTSNVLEIGLECDRSGMLKKANYISTIFICGTYEGVFRENDLDVGQKFNTTYEQSKYEAEKLIEKYRMKGLWIDVFRPPIILGESTTGKMLSFNQAFFQALHIWNLELFDYYPVEKDYFFNIVFVDELCKSIFKISSNTSVKNKNYHPFSTQPVSLEKIINLFFKFSGNKKPRFISTLEFLEHSTPAQRALLEYNFFFKNRNVRLDSEMTNNFLRKCGFSFSNFNKRLFFSQLNYATKMGFLKKK